MQLVRKLFNFIYRDVKDENETKKVSVIIRLTSIVMIGYFSVIGLIFLIGQQWVLAALSPLCFMGYGLSIYITYINRTKMAQLFNAFLTLVWISLYIHQIGWDMGVQHFIFVSVVLAFTTSYASKWVKFFECFLLCMFRYSLYFYTKAHSPITPLTPKLSMVCQLVDTFFVFLNMCVILYVFTKDAQEMEKKLVDYNICLKEQVSVDPLTGLYNRRYMMDYIQNIIDERRNDRGMCIAISDIDFFKKVNDTYGHATGDMVLKEVANVFKDFMEGKGAVARWGGEEFLFVFEDCNLDDAKIHMIDVLGIVKKKQFQYEEGIFQITMTAGVEDYGYSSTLDEAISAADKKLYMGKTSGRDKVVV